MSAVAVVRSCIFAGVQLLVTPPWAVASLLSFPLPPLARYRIISAWSKLIVWTAAKVCGVRYRVVGRENIPATPCVILGKHESAWETLAFQAIFPPQVWVIKRELLFIPFFGWGLAMLSPIAIDRKAGRRALRQMREQGTQRLQQGFSIVVFPEGTRSLPGIPGTYQVGGAWLALETGAAILPVAHNAGTYWPKNSFVKRPGEITVSIGPVIQPHGKAAELMREVEQWIETEMLRLRAQET